MNIADSLTEGGGEYDVSYEYKQTVLPKGWGNRM